MLYDNFKLFEGLYRNFFEESSYDMSGLFLQQKTCQSDAAKMDKWKASDPQEQDLNTRKENFSIIIISSLGFLYQEFSFAVKVTCLVKKMQK